MLFKRPVHAKDLEEKYLTRFIIFFWNLVPSLKSAKYVNKIGTIIIMLHIIFWLFFSVSILVWLCALDSNMRNTQLLVPSLKKDDLTPLYALLRGWPGGPNVRVK